MTAAYYTQPKLLKFDRSINLATDTIKCGLVNASFPARSTSEGYEYVADLTGGVAEVTGATGYSRLTMTTVVISTSALVTSLTITAPSPITWGSSTITATGAFWYDDTAGTTDANKPLLAVWDFGGAQSSSNGNFTLTLASNVLITWTSAA